MQIAVRTCFEKYMYANIYLPLLESTLTCSLHVGYVPLSEKGSDIIVIWWFHVIYIHCSDNLRFYGDIWWFNGDLWWFMFKYPNQSWGFCSSLPWPLQMWPPSRNPSPSGTTWPPWPAGIACPGSSPTWRKVGCPIYIYGNSRILKWRYLPYIRPM